MSIKYRIYYLLSKPKDYVIVYVHIPKCGGTSFSEFLKRNVNPFRSYEVSLRRRADNQLPWSFINNKDNNVGSVINDLLEFGSRYDCILGHVPYGVDEYIEKPCLYVTLLRDPVKRVWSQFNHILNQDDHYLNPYLAKYNYDIESVLESGEIFEFCNDQVRMISGTDKVEIDDSVLEYAKYLLKEKYFFVSSLEESRKAIVRLSNQLRWKYVELPVKNVGHYKMTSSQPDDKLINIIREFNRYDCELYEWIVNL